MEVFQSLSNREIIEKSTIIKNLVGLDISAVASATAIDAIIDDQITSEPTRIYNITNNGSLSGLYNTIKWQFYEKSGLNNMESIVGEASSSSVTASAVKVISVPRETLKQRITPSSCSASISFAPNTTVWYVKDDPVTSTSGDSLFQGKLKVSTSSSFSPTASTTSIGEVFYNHGLFVFRGSIVGNQSLSACLTNTYDMVFDTSQTNGQIEVNAFSFRRQQQKTKQIFFCRAYNNTHNYSNNPTYRNSDGTVKTDILNLGNMTFVTAVGLYDNSNDLLAVAKVNPVAKKTDEDELIFKIAVTY